MTKIRSLEQVASEMPGLFVSSVPNMNADLKTMTSFATKLRDKGIDNLYITLSSVNNGQVSYSLWSGKPKINENGIVYKNQDNANLFMKGMQDITNLTGAVNSSRKDIRGTDYRSKDTSSKKRTDCKGSECDMTNFGRDYFRGKDIDFQNKISTRSGSVEVYKVNGIEKRL